MSTDSDFAETEVRRQVDRSLEVAGDALQEDQVRAIVSGLERRIMRVEERADLSDQRLTQTEEKLEKLTTAVTQGFADLQTELRSGLSGLKATFVTKDDAVQAQRQATNAMWAAAGAVVGTLALLFTVYQTFAPKPPAGSTAAQIQPIVIQIPYPPTPSQLPAPKKPGG